jgi:hypothetical protein
VLEEETAPACHAATEGPTAEVVKGKRWCAREREERADKREMGGCG